MPLRIIAAILVVFLLGSCAPMQATKEELKETDMALPPSEDIKLPELPQKPPEAKETRKVESIRVEKEADEKYVILNFDGADIETVISTIGELLNINYIIGAGVSGKVTIQSYRKFPVKDLFQIFQTILEVNGLTAVKDGTLYRIVPIDTAKQQPVSVQIGKDVKLQLDSSFITQIIPLEYVKANDIVNVLRNLMPRGTDLTVYEPTNLLIVTAPPAGIVKFMKVLEALDISSVDRESIRTFVYYVENGEAKKLAEILKSLYAEKKDGRASSPRLTSPLPGLPKGTVTTAAAEGLPGEVEGEIVIAAYEDINAIVIKTNPRSYLAVLEILKKLDVPVKQVLIEVLIAEVTLDDKTVLGIEWLLKGRLHAEGESLSSLTGFNPSSSISSSIGSSLALVPTSPFASVIKPERFGILLNALSTLENVNVLASPHILAMDNKEASIQIGDEVPIATGLTQQPSTGTGATTLVSAGQIQYKTVGTLLTVKPHITEKNRVTLDITQEVSQLGADVTVASQSFSRFKTRKAKTSAVVQSGHTLVLGGLITESKSQGRSGIPFLSKIPVLGYLFGTTTDKFNKTELLLMVTPHVINNQEEADAVTREFQDKVKTVKERLEKNKPDDEESTAKSEVSNIKNIVTVAVGMDTPLIELIEAHGYTLKDEDLNVFLSEFIALNEDIKSIKMIPKGSTVKLPLTHLKKTKNKN
ncbi:MAG: secretin N-terminal domain-containing protein [Thermodesulfovibrionales bacterium]|nr:secretin N-terminal domain-containing protein [Thermodesulfovibrionales bacterium]